MIILEALKYTSIESIIEPERNFEEYNTNPILGVVRGVDGLKTGYTNRGWQMPYGNSS